MNNVHQLAKKKKEKRLARWAAWSRLLVFQTDLHHSLRVHTRKQTEDWGEVWLDNLSPGLELWSSVVSLDLIVCGEPWSSVVSLHLIICGESWSCVVSWSDHLWWVLIVYGESWSDHLWWVLIICGESWSSMVSRSDCGESWFDHLWWVLVSLVRLVFSPLMVQIRSVWDYGDEISLLIALVLSRYTRYSAVCDCLLPQSRKWFKLSRFLWFVINVKSSLDLELPGPIQTIFPVFSFTSVQLRHFSF